MQEQSNLVNCCSFALERVVQLRIKEKADLLLGIMEAIERENIGTGVILSGDERTRSLDLCLKEP